MFKAWFAYTWIELGVHLWCMHSIFKCIADLKIYRICERKKPRATNWISVQNKFFNIVANIHVASLRTKEKIFFVSLRTVKMELWKYVTTKNELTDLNHPSVRFCIFPFYFLSFMSVSTHLKSHGMNRYEKDCKEYIHGDKILEWNDRDNYFFFSLVKKE